MAVYDQTLTVHSQPISCKLRKVCHVGDASHRSRLIETVIEKDSKLDILVSNAAVNPYFGSMLDTPEASWDKIFEINVKNAFQLIQESVPHLEKQVCSYKSLRPGSRNIISGAQLNRLCLLNCRAPTNANVGCL